MEESIDSFLEKFRNFLDKKEYYVALQRVKSVNFRYLLAKKYEQSDELLFRCLKLFLRTEETSTSIELAKLYLSLLEKTTNLTKDHFITEIISIFDLINLSSFDWDPIVARFLNWSKKLNDEKIEIQLQLAIANAYIRASRCNEARFHSSYITESVLLIEFMIKYSLSFIYPEELDLFTLQVVLQILNKPNVALANSFFYGFVTKHPECHEAYGFPYSVPLFNFIHLILLSITAKSYDQFVLLGKLYEPLLNLDPFNQQNFKSLEKVFFPTNTPAESRGNSTTQNSTLTNSIFDLVRSFLPSLGGNASTSTATSTTSNPANTSQSAQPPNNNNNDSELD